MGSVHGRARRDLSSSDSGFHVRTSCLCVYIYIYIYIRITSMWELLKHEGSNIDPNIVGLILQGHPRNGPNKFQKRPYMNLYVPRSKSLVGIPYKAYLATKTFVNIQRMEKSSSSSGTS